MNLNGKLRKNLGGLKGGQANICGGHGPLRPSLRIATACRLSIHQRNHL